MKKVLSIVLVIAMVLGSFSMVFGAETLADRADINPTFNEAIDVMVATGIIEGVKQDEGPNKFNPTAEVTRAQMAKMIAALKNGGDDVQSLYASANKFTDMEDAQWAKGYVAYCVGQGIIAGKNETQFFPSDPVTATEAAKMLLVAIGYDANIEGFVGSQWKVNTQAKAKDADLYDDTDIANYDAPLTREVAAQLIFNAMNAYTMEYKEQTSIKVGDVEVNTNRKAEEVTKANGWGPNGEVPLWQEAFGSDMKKDSAKSDDLGRPAHKWTYDKKEIGTYADSDDYTFVSDDSYTTDGAKNVLAFIKDHDEDLRDDINDTKGTVSVKLNGKTVVSNSNLEAKIYKGDVVEIFEQDVEGKDYYNYVIVIERYMAVQISDVDKDVKSADKADGVSAYITLDAQLDGGSYTVNDDDLPGYDPATYVEDAWIAVAFEATTNADGDVTIANTAFDAVKSSKDVCDSYLLDKPVRGEITRIATTSAGADSKYTIDGKVYTLGGTYVSDEGDNVKAGDTYDLYLDKNGYGLYSELYEDASDKKYAILTGVNDASNFNDKDAWQVRLLTTDGKETIYDVKTSSDAADAITANGTGKGTFKGYTDSNNDGTANYSTKTQYISSTNAVIVKYSLDSAGKVKTLETGSDVDIETVAKGEVKKTGTIGSQRLADSVLAFFYDDDDDGEWKVYKYNDLLEKDIDVDAEGVISSGKISILLLRVDIEDTNTVFGVVSDLSTSRNSDNDPVYEVEIISTEGQKTYNTVKVDDDLEAFKTAFDAQNAPDGVPFVAYATLNKDNEITAITYNKMTPLDAAKKDIDEDKDEVIMFSPKKDAAYATAETKTNFKSGLLQVSGVSGSSIKFGTNDGKNNYSDETSYIDIADAAVIRVTWNSDDEKFEYAKANASAVKKNGWAMLFQSTDDNDDAWDTVIYISSGDLEDAYAAN